MRTLFTEFAVDSRKTAEDFLGLSVQWLRGMPSRGYAWPPADTLAQGDDFNISNVDEHAHFRRIQEQDYEGAGIQYRLEGSDGLNWTTEAVWWRQKNEARVSIRVTCVSESINPRVPTPHKPHIIKLLLSNGWGGQDGDLHVTDKPIEIAENAVDNYAQILNGYRGNTLPVVYITRTRNGDTLVQCQKLAERLGGLAHVLVESDLKVARKLAPKTFYLNPYLGAIGVYWPEGLGREIYRRSDFHSEHELREWIFRDVVTAHTNRRGMFQCTWGYLQEVWSQQAIRLMQQRGVQNVDAYTEKFDSELRAKDERIREYEQLIEDYKRRLDSEIKNRKPDAIFRIPDGMEEFYPGEINDVIISTLKSCTKNIAGGTRREQVISAMLQGKNTSSYLDEVKNLIKNTLKNYVSMDKTTRDGLREAGFEITEDSKHHKLIFNGDHRYTFPFSKTSSDHRAGRNMASDIIKKLFV